MSVELVDAAKVLHREQQVLIMPPNNTYPVRGEIFSFSDTHLMLDVDRSSVPVGFVPPERGAEVQITFTGRDCLYKVTVHLQDNLSERERLWRFELPRKLIREQKRRYVRIPAHLPIRLSMADGVGKFDSSVYSETVDISAGGVSFVSPHKVAVGQTLFVILEQLPGLESFPVLGDVVRCVKEEPEQGSPGQEEDQWRVAINMEPHLQGGMQERLVNSVAVMQRKYLKDKFNGNK